MSVQVEAIGRRLPRAMTILLEKKTKQVHQADLLGSSNYLLII